MNEDFNFFDEIKKDVSYAAKYDEATEKVQLNAKRLIFDFNNTAPDEKEKRAEILSRLFGTYNPMAAVETPFHCDYGFNIHLNGFVLMNYNCTILDTSPVHIGNNVFIAPNVVIACAGHAIHPEERIFIETSKPVFIEDDVWIGANVTVLGGVTIGSGSVIGAGSVVNKSIPKNVVAAGNPCRVIRKITDADKMNLEEDFKLI